MLKLALAILGLAFVVAWLVMLATFILSHKEKQ